MRKTQQAQISFNPKTELLATLKSGYGYWDTTHYPYGGCFRRATENTDVVITGNGGKYPAHERKIRFEDGRTGVAGIGSLEVSK